MAKERVKVALRGNCYDIRFTFGGKQLRLGLGLFDTPTGRLQAKEIANTIERDIMMGCFDPDKLKTYKPAYKEREKVKVAVSERTIISVVWEYYKKHKDIAETTRKGHYSLIDKALALFPNQDVKTFSDNVNSHYAPSTQYQIYRGLRTAFNFYKKTVDREIKHVFSELATESREKKGKSKRTKQAFTKDEATAIIGAFKSGKYATPGYEDNDIHYSRLVEFLFNTGCRIEDALALTYGDISENVITFHAAYSRGVHKTTKNATTRRFPITDKIRTIVDLGCKRGYRELVFPSITGKHICLNGFRGRYWQRVLAGLLRDGLISRYLPPYHTRHTFISLCRDDGVPDAYIAQWVETSESMIVKHYSDTLSDNFKPVGI